MDGWMRGELCEARPGAGGPNCERYDAGLQNRSAMGSCDMQHHHYHVRRTRSFRKGFIPRRPGETETTATASRHELY